MRTQPYDEEKMKRLETADGFIGYAVKSLVRDGNTKGSALKAVYSSEIIAGNSEMKEAYNNA